MESYRTEDEQVEALKKWWKEKGTSTLLSIAVVLGGYFGWQGWQAQQLGQAEAASANYQQLLQLSLELDEEATDARYATASHLVDALKTDHSSSDYARFAALLQAKLQVAQEDYTAAQAELQWVLDSDPEPALAQVATLRMARLQYASGDSAAALALATEVEAGEFAVAANELRGDIYYKQGDFDGARSAYQEALQLSGADASAAPLVKMKLESLPQSDPAPAQDE